MDKQKSAKRLERLLEETSTPESSEHDPFSDDGEYGSDEDYEPYSSSVNEEQSSESTESLDYLDIHGTLSTSPAAHLEVQNLPGTSALTTRSRDTTNSTSSNEAITVTPRAVPDISVSSHHNNVLTEPSCSSANDICEDLDTYASSNQNTLPETAFFSSNIRENLVISASNDRNALPNTPSASSANNTGLDTSASSDQNALPEPTSHLSANNIIDASNSAQNRRTASNTLPASTTATTTSSEEWKQDTKSIPDFQFDFSSQGLNVELGENTSPLDMFRLAFSEELLDLLISKTNAYGTKLANTNRPHTRHSRKKSFRPVDKDEMLAFLGLCLLSGQVKAPKKEKLFSYSNPLYYHPFFSYVMSGRRFQQILRCIYVGDLDAKGEEKVTDFINVLSENFRRIYSPGRELSIDESLILFRGRLRFRQYMKLKKAKYGIKFFELTTSDGYVLNIIMYEGAKKNNGQPDQDKTKKTEKIVMKLLRPYLMRGHHVYMDNYYNDVELSDKLLHFKTHTTGTLRKTRTSNPKVLTTMKLKKGDYFWRRKNHVYVSVWMDKRPVYCITTYHHPRLSYVPNRFGVISKKPKEVAEYNAHMGGIDRKDQMVSYYSSPKKTIRWYKKVFFHMLDIAVWNAFYLYKKNIKNNEKYQFLDFRDELIKQMAKVNPNMTGKDMVRQGSIFSSRRHNEGAVEAQRSQHDNNEAVPPSMQTHWPEKIPVPENSKRNVKYLNCSLCYKNKKRKETRYRCKGCIKKTPLCPECFEEWHATHINV